MIKIITNDEINEVYKIIMCMIKDYFYLLEYIFFFQSVTNDIFWKHYANPICIGYHVLAGERTGRGSADNCLRCVERRNYSRQTVSDIHIWPCNCLLKSSMRGYSIVRRVPTYLDRFNCHSKPPNFIGGE